VAFPLLRLATAIAFVVYTVIARSEATKQSSLPS
jgi:hypothetical protein